MNSAHYTIYGLFAGPRCRYVGATLRFERRTRQHLLNGWIKKFPHLIAKQIWTCCGTEKAIRFERLAIQIWKPDLNKNRGGGGELVRSHESRVAGGKKAVQTRKENAMSGKTKWLESISANHSDSPLSL